MPIINVALKDNKIVTIDEVERGLACDCVCIYCHARLKARKGDEREHHFAHHDAHDTMACYESAFRVATREAFRQTGEIKLPINRTDEEHKIVRDEFIFKYSEVNILDSVKRAGNGLEILVELRNDNDIVLDVLICTGNKSSRCVGAVDFRDNISRVRINLVNVQALTFDEFRRYLAYDIDSKEWIYNRKEEAVKRTLREQKDFATTNYVKEKEIVENKIINHSVYKRSTYISNRGYAESKNNVIGKEAYIREQDRGIKEKLPRGYCPYCANPLKVVNANGFDVLQCNICKFTAEINRDEKTIRFRKKFGDKAMVIEPIPEKFMMEDKEK